MPMPETEFHDVNGLQDKNKTTAYGAAKMLYEAIKAHKAWYAKYFGQTEIKDTRSQRPVRAKRENASSRTIIAC